MTLDQVITMLGGEAAVQAHCKCGASAVSNWRARGLPPGRKFDLALMAKQRGVKLTLEQLATVPSSRGCSCEVA
jgi:hypothetical protein